MTCFATGSFGFLVPRAPVKGHLPDLIPQRDDSMDAWGHIAILCCWQSSSAGGSPSGLVASRAYRKKFPPGNSKENSGRTSLERRRREEELHFSMIKLSALFLRNGNAVSGIETREDDVAFKRCAAYIHPLPEDTGVRKMADKRPSI